MSDRVVLHVVSELYPFVKTGGLADVARALPEAQRRLGRDVGWVVPGYPAVLAALRDARPVWRDGDLFGGGAAELLSGRLEGSDVPAFVLACPGHFAREGGPYVGADGRDYPDNHLRFAALGWAAAERARAAGAVLHAHDWQGGLGVAYAKLRAPSVPCVATIHNIAYPGSFDASVRAELGLPESAYGIRGVEFYGRLSFLKAALYYAGRITTVSPTYAAEITEDGAGGGFEGLLRDRGGDLVGILNGIDRDEWDASRDAHLPAHYDLDALDGKARCRQELAARSRLDLTEGTFVLGMVSRLVPQKGVDWLLEVVPRLVARDAALVVVGSGDRDLEEGLRAAAARHPGRIAVHLGYDEALAHLVQAGSDSIAVPSRAEPCGLTQLYALRYGSPPIVRRTGGLADTVVDATPAARRGRRGTGFVFDGADAESLWGAIERALAVHAKPASWRAVQHAGMRQDFGWERSARAYLDLYDALAPAPPLDPSEPPR